MVNPSLMKQFYQELESWALEQIRAGQQSISLMAEIREGCAGDWEIEELTRAIIFDEVQIMESMKGEAERARTSRKESERV
jgi:hypothetical protein